MRFFYEGALLLTPRNAAAVADAARRLRVDSVAAAARAYVRGHLAPGTAAGFLLQALQCGAEELTEECLVATLTQCAACGGGRPGGGGWWRAAGRGVGGGCGSARRRTLVQRDPRGRRSARAAGRRRAPRSCTADSAPTPLPR